MGQAQHHHPPTPSSEEEGEPIKAPSSLEEGVGGGGPTRKLLLHRAAEMRRNPTEPERRLWMELRDSRFCGYKFRRQVVIGRRILDFFCPTKGLGIEVDGHTHDFVRDRARDARLERETGFAVIRFTNPDVMENLDGVLRALQIALEGRPDRWSNAGRHHPPAPSSQEEGEQDKAPSSLEEGVGGGGPTR